MSHYSEKEYRPHKAEKELWFDELYFQRWFTNVDGPILDMGCATGNFIANAPDLIEGIDIDEDGLKIARERGFRVQKLDLENEMPRLETNRYAAIYAKHVIEHLDKPLAVLKEIKRVLRPGGFAVISTPNCPYTLKRMFYDDYTHVHPFTNKSLIMLARDAGFSEFSVSEDFRCLPGLGRFMRLTKIQPESIADLQHALGIRGLSLILEVRKNPKNDRI